MKLKFNAMRIFVKQIVCGFNMENWGGILIDIVNTCSDAMISL